MVNFLRGYRLLASAHKWSIVQKLLTIEHDKNHRGSSTAYLFTTTRLTGHNVLNKEGINMAQDNTEADAYYGEDDANNEELDLSFLDEDEPKK